MTEEPDVDVDELRSDLDQIKSAMGISERYSGATQIWLLFGVAVPIAAALSQYVHLEQLPYWYHNIIWLGIIGGILGLGVWWNSDWDVSGTGTGKPNLWLQFLIVYLAAIPLQSIADAYTADLGYVAESAQALAIVLVVLAIAYGVFGSSMRAYHIRRRDRYVFYVGTVWMIGLAMAIPQYPTLERWAYAAFGGAYFVYAMGAYLFLRSTGEIA